MRLSAALLLLASSLCAKSATGPPDAAQLSCNPVAPPGDLPAIERTRDLFLDRLRDAGAPLGWKPEVKEEPSAPRTRLSPDGRALLIAPARGQCLREWLDRWFLPARELARAARPGASEAWADDLAVAFFHSLPGGEERLANLQTVLRSVASHAELPDEVRNLPDSLARRTALRFPETLLAR